MEIFKVQFEGPIIFYFYSNIVDVLLERDVEAGYFGLFLGGCINRGTIREYRMMYRAPRLFAVV
jgi:hypothetical protein